MTPLRILFAGLLAVGTMLYVLNPGPEAFEHFYRLDTAERAEAAARAADSTLGGTSRVFLADRTGRAVSDAENVAYERTDYHVASLYRVDTNAEQAGGTWTFLGIANWFVPIEQPPAGEVTQSPGSRTAAPRFPGMPGG